MKATEGERETKRLRKKTCCYRISVLNYFILSYLFSFSFQYNVLHNLFDDGDDDDDDVHYLVKKKVV